MEFHVPEDRRTWTTLQTKCVDPLMKTTTTLVHEKVRMNSEIYIGKQLVLNIQNKDQRTNTET